MDGFVSSESEHFYFLMSKEDQPVLSGHAARLAEEVYDRLTKRYGFTPEGPIQIEFFPDSGGFSVRTLGLPDFRALGVCFGKVVAMDSPRALSPGEFNWGSTLWHEFTHVMTLQMTNHNIPRWYSEGLSVYEERRARPGWGDDLSAAVVKAYQEGKLLKVSELNSGMMRPKFPGQVALSYYQASLFCELVEKKFGFDKIKESLKMFAENQPSHEVFQQVLGWDMAQLDEEYGRFVDERLKLVATRLKFERTAPGTPPQRRGPDKSDLEMRLREDPDDFFANLQLGAILRQEKANREAEAYLKKAQTLFPEFAGPGNPYELLGDFYSEQKREEEALAQYEGWSSYNENASLPLMRAADIYRGREDWTNAMKKLELSVYIYPYEREIHEKLGESAMEAADWDSAVGAYEVLLGLDPDDPAGTHFQLARAWLGKGDLRKAKRSTLRALEIAPMYVPAQRMLLKLNRGEPNDPESEK